MRLPHRARILVIRLERIGDVLVGVPVLRALRRPLSRRPHRAPGEPPQPRRGRRRAPVRRPGLDLREDRPLRPGPPARAPPVSVRRHRRPGRPSIDHRPARHPVVPAARRRRGCSTPSPVSTPMRRRRSIRPWYIRSSGSRSCCCRSASIRPWSRSTWSTRWRPPTWSGRARLWGLGPALSPRRDVSGRQPARYWGTARLRRPDPRHHGPALAVARLCVRRTARRAGSRRIAAAAGAEAVPRAR